MLEFVPALAVQAGPGLHMRAGIPYITFEPILQKWLGAGLKGQWRPYEPPNRWDGGPVPNLLLIGGGGMGDRIQSTPALREASRRAGCPIDACHVGEAQEWQGLPYVGLTFPMLPTKAQVESYAAVVDFCGVVGEPDAAEAELHHLFARRFGVELTDVAPDYQVAPGEERHVWLPPKRRLRVGIHFGRQAPARVWPPAYLLELIGALSVEHEVLILGLPGEGPNWQVEVNGIQYLVPPPSEYIIDYCGMTSSVRALAVAMQTCDVFVDVDSGPLHLAGALGIPSVGLYGPFPHRIRGTNLPTVHPLQADLDPERPECSCYTHATMGEELPCKQQCCSLMEAIKPGMVVEAVEAVICEHALHSPPAEAAVEFPVGGRPA